MDPRAFKFQVRKYMKSSTHLKVQNLRKDFKTFTGLSWEEFWGARHVMKRDTWADHVFIQSAAWYLQKDIVIHQNITSQPAQKISGNIDDETVPCRDPQIHVGYLFRRHYQSVIPKEKGFSEVKDISNVTSNDSSCCPICKKSFKSVLQHIKKAKNCQEKMNPHDLEKLQDEASKKTKDKKREWKATWKEQNEEKEKEGNRASVAKYRRLNTEKAREDSKASMAKS